MSRLDAVKELLAQDPANSRVRFMLGMEYLAASMWPEALAELKELIAREPDYVAAYYQAGRAAESCGDFDAARALYRAGIAAAQRAGDTHTASELSVALDIIAD